MVAVLNIHNKISPDDYLLGERDAEIKHEYIDAEMFAMSGASDNHNKITQNTAFALTTQIRKHDFPCFAYTSDMKVKVNNKNFFYPDVMVVCDRNDTKDDYYKTSPKLIVEVLSKSTRRKDKMVKRLHYQNLASLEEYVLIEQTHCEIEVFRKNKAWNPQYYYLGDEITFESLDLTIPVEELYYQVNNEEMQTFLAKNQTEKQS